MLRPVTQGCTVRCGAVLCCGVMWCDVLYCDVMCCAVLTDVLTVFSVVLNAVLCWSVEFLCYAVLRRAIYSAVM